MNGAARAGRRENLRFEQGEVPPLFLGREALPLDRHDLGDDLLDSHLLQLLWQRVTASGRITFTRSQGPSERTGKEGGTAHLQAHAAAVAERPGLQDGPVPVWMT